MRGAASHIANSLIVRRDLPGAIRRLQLFMLWLLAVSGFFVFREPSPYEVVFLATAIVFVLTGARLTFAFAPLLLCLVAFNIGGLVSLIPFLDEQKPVTFTAVTLYLSITSIFFASIMLERTEARLRGLKSGYVLAGLIASLAAIIGYFDVAGLGSILTRYGRAAGTFKDPNVYSTFIVPPAVFLVQDLLLGRGRTLLRAAGLMVLMIGSLLAFSRGGWGNMAASLLLLALITFLTTPSVRLQARVLLVCALGVVAASALLVAVLSIDAVRVLFEQRASLSQAYDLGETGRFGHQLNSLPMLLTRPNGLGPLQFFHYFGEDPHNVYINAFASYGWLGGFAYFTLIATTLIAGVRTILTRSTLQPHAVAVFAPFLVVALQGLQIDTDHWRHAYLLMGLIWGLYGATMPERQARAATLQPRMGLPAAG